MSAIEIKTELRQMIEQENDVSVLEAILTILQKTSLNPMLKEKLTTRAMKSEKDIVAGKLFSKEEVAQHTHRK